MLIVHRRSWFKAGAVVMAASTLWLAVAQTASAATRRSSSRARVDDVAARLGVDSAAVAGIEPGEAARRVAERRAHALERLSKRTSSKEGGAEAARIAGAIRRAHLPSLLGGVARATQEARVAAAQAASSDARTRERGAARLDGLSRAIDHAVRRVEADASPDARLKGAIANARRLARASDEAARSPGTTGSQNVQRLAPPRRPELDTRGRAPMMLQRLSPPSPRLRTRLGAVPSLDERAFYASILDAVGAEVETEVGPVAPALIAAGLPPDPLLATGSLDGDLGDLLELAAGALPGPTPADLADGPDARITTSIREAVESLGRDPLAIYNFVHDGFDAEPYYGAKKGSVGAWEERAGNDADLASLLVAMLRAAEIPARYEYGTVDLTPEQAMAWTGTTEVFQAADALATGGIPTIVVESGTERVVRVEHVWVRAWVPYSNYRGIPRTGSRSAWVRLDPTLQRARIREATNLRGKVAFDREAFLSQVGPQTPLAILEEQLRAYAQANGIPCRTLDDFIPARERIADGLSLLPAELPARIQSSLATFAALPSSMRHVATIGVGGADAVLPLPEIYGAALGLRYRGATAGDDAAIAAAGGIGSVTQPYAVRVVPTLVIDGTERARGDAVMPGTPQEMVVQVASPHDGTGVIRHQLFAGSVFAIGFPVGKVPDAVVERRELELSQATLAGATGDDLESARGNRALWRYFWRVSRDWERIFGLEWARVGFGVSEGIAGRTLVAETLYDIPVSIRPGSYVIDVPRLVAGPYSVDGQQRERLRSVFELAGYHGSTWEHLVWEQTVHAPSISTVRIFQAARQQGQQLRTLTPVDAPSVAALPFSESARDDIANALHRGLVVTIPERPVTWATYANAEGYVLQNPLTGAADYRIRGLYSGGESNGSGPPDRTSCPPCAGPNGPAGSSVSFSDGAMYFSETDLVVPARGIPITLARSYNSGSPYGGRLGPGWQHTYEIRLIPEPDGAVTYVNDDQLAVRYARAQDGTFIAPPGTHERLLASADGYRLIFKGGLEYRFRTDGQLMAIQDPNDHLVLLRYDAGRLSTVTDAGGRTALTFEYDAAGQLATVRDVSNRVVQYGHEGGDLVSVTDVVNEVQRYGYDSAHRMTSKTDKSGNVLHEFYDAEGRWVGSSDATGHGRAVSYDMLNRRALHEDKTGAVRIHEYSERGNPVAITDAVGNRRELRWDGAHNKIWEKDARGNEASYTYDAAGNLETATDALGGVTRYTYDDGGRVLTVTVNGKLVAQNTYDPRGNLETSTDALGKVTRYGYTGDGLPETITQPGDAVTRLTYNPDGTVRAITDGENGTTELGYDAYGHLRSIKDPLLQERVLVSDAAGRIQSMTDALLKTTTFEYDAEGNRIAIVDADLRRTEFGYDALNRLVSLKDAKGAVSRTEYDAEDRVLARTDALGRTVRHRYDAEGRLIEATDAAGNTTTQGYCADVGTQPCAIVDAAGNYTEIELDALGRPTTTLDGNGTPRTERYDAFGRRDRSVVAGQVTQFEYDDAGRLTKVIDALLGVTEYGYDDRGNRTSVTDANGKITSFGYDKANRLVWERTPIQPAGSETSYEYDAAGNRRFKTDGNGRRTEYVYDANRRLTAVLFADGTRYDYAYDARGNRTLEKSPTHERGLAYDELGRLTRIEDRTLGRVIEYAYDALGQRERMSVDTGEVTRYRWDAAGRLLETVDPEGHATRFTYDAAGRRTGATYGNGTRATYSYDAAGQVLSLAYLDRTGAVQTAFGYGYDAAGNRTHKSFADGTRETYGYDGLNRLTYAKYPDDREVSYGYDAVGNRKEMVDTAARHTLWAVSAQASSAYQPASYATGAPDEVSWQASYGAGHEWLEVTFPSARQARAIRIRETNAAPAVVRVDLVDEGGGSHTVYSGGDATANGGWLVVPFPLTSYKVSKAKIVTEQQYEGIDAVGLDVAGAETYAYNGFNQLLSVSGVDGRETTFGYDGNGNQVSKSVRTGWVTQKSSYAYDQDNRLRTVTVPSGPPTGEATVQWGTSATASSSYGEGTGNWSASQATGAPDEAGCLASGRSWAPASWGTGDPEWLRVEYATPVRAVGVKIRENRDSGSVTKVELVDEGGTSHEVWAGTDTTACGGTLEVAFEETPYKVKAVKVTTGGVSWEEIDAVGLVSAPPSGPTLTSTYEYDANGLRTYKSDSAGETRYLLDGLSVIAQYAPGGARQAWYTQSLARIDEVLSVVNDSGKQWYQADALGSVYALTNASGNLVGHQNYDVFGAPTPAPSGPAGQPFGFTGREHELDSGLVYARNRYLSTVTGTWNRPDPMGFVDGPNVYAYAKNGPTRWSDPTGQFIIAVPPVLIAAGLAAAVGAAVGAVTALIGGLGPSQGAFWQSVLVSAVSAAFGVVLPFGPVGAALAGMVMSGVSNAIGQLITMNAQPGTGFSYLSLALAMASGFISGFFGALLGPNSGLATFATELESYMIPTIVGLVLGGAGDISGAIIMKMVALYQAVHYDEVGKMCVP
jgi:RHS repeat-associated protein